MTTSLVQVPPQHGRGAASAPDPGTRVTLLPGGWTVVLRPVETGDVEVLREVFDQLSPRSRELRFLTAKPTLTNADLRQLSAVDHRDHEAIAALTTDGRAVGLARFVRDDDDPETAEVAFEVADAWQGRGVGSVLATALLTRAHELGVSRVVMSMAHDNEPALRLMMRILGDVERVAIDAHTAEFAVDLRPARRTHRSRRVRSRLKGAPS
jgi:RimJ/RimL family protein N-acetyltransferase